jgi:hypothetical protein
MASTAAHSFWRYQTLPSSPQDRQALLLRSVVLHSDVAVWLSNRGERVVNVVSQFGLAQNGLEEMARLLKARRGLSPAFKAQQLQVIAEAFLAHAEADKEDGANDGDRRGR